MPEWRIIIKKTTTETIEVFCHIKRQNTLTKIILEEQSKKIENKADGNTSGMTTSRSGRPAVSECTIKSVEILYSQSSSWRWNLIDDELR